MPITHGCSFMKNASNWPAELPRSPASPSFIHAVRLEDTLCQINADRCNLHDGLSPRVGGMAFPIWHIDAVSGAGVHTIAGSGRASPFRAGCWVWGGEWCGG